MWSLLHVITVKTQRFLGKTIDLNYNHIKGLLTSRYQLLVTITMDIEKTAAKITKQIEKLNWQLNSGLALLKQQRDTKKIQTADLKKDFASLEAQFTTLKVTKIKHT